MRCVAYSITVRDGTHMVRCPDPTCDFASASGIEVTRHIQRTHVSRNEPGAVRVFPADWVPGGMPITDTGGLRERLDRRPFQRGVRARRSGKRWARRVA